MGKRIAIAMMTATLTATCSMAQLSMTIDANQRGPEISPYQYGLFFEEINHAGDGGLYAEMVQNRSFEDDKEKAVHWSEIAPSGAQVETSLTSTNLMNNAQKRALKVDVTGASVQTPAGVANEGYWGMKFRRDSTYTLTLWAKTGKKKLKNKLIARLLDEKGNTVGEAAISGEINSKKWNKLTVAVKATGNADKGSLAILATKDETIYLDMVSLFPYTWKGRKNGMRPDLAQLLADTKPTFLRFPGGCYVEGEIAMENSFRWKETIGPIECRPGHLNANWRYYSTDGLGFDEYLQLSEDLGAAPLFVVSVGLGHGFTVPMADVDTLVQNALDAIEYANGDASTFWGAKRIANGHPAPYNLKFIEIGNENYQADARQQSEDYPERYYRFYKAIKEKYPEIITIGNVEAWGTDNPSWRNDYPVEMVDEHYYRSHSWMRENYHKYDNYSRKIAVYNGEYAANYGGTYGTYGNMNSALGEAVYMLGMEKNSDVCRMASFAPIFTHEMNPHWPYDMIHFNAAKNFCTPSYYVQKLMANNIGKQNLKWTEVLPEPERKATQVGVGAWATLVSYDDVKITSDKTSAADDFSKDLGNWTKVKGSWNISSGVCSLPEAEEDCRLLFSDKMQYDSYSYSLRARKDGGNEGFLIIFGYEDSNNYYWWNLGGWGNQQHGIEHCVSGAKSTISTAPGRIEEGRWYDIRIDVKGDSVKCYLDDKLCHSFVMARPQEIFQSCQIDDEKGELLLKVVNSGSTDYVMDLNLRNMTAQSGTVIRYKGKTGMEENTMDEPFNIIPDKETALKSVSKLDIPAFSLNIFRFRLRK